LDGGDDLLGWTLFSFDGLAAYERVEDSGLDFFAIYFEGFNFDNFPVFVAFCQDNPATESAGGFRIFTRHNG
jgi:hypothetical protein